MRKALVALSLGAFVVGAVAPIVGASAAEPKLSKLGCVVGKQRWDASAGKCIDAKPVAKAKAKAKTKMTSKTPAMKAPAKKAPAQKAPAQKAPAMKAMEKKPS